MHVSPVCTGLTLRGETLQPLPSPSLPCSGWPTPQGGSRDYCDLPGACIKSSPDQPDHPGPALAVPRLAPLSLPALLQGNFMMPSNVLPSNVRHIKSEHDVGSVMSPVDQPAMPSVPQPACEGSCPVPVMVPAAATGSPPKLEAVLAEERSPRGPAGISHAASVPPVAYVPVTVGAAAAGLHTSAPRQSLDHACRPHSSSGGGNSGGGAAARPCSATGSAGGRCTSVPPCSASAAAAALGEEHDHRLTLEFLEENGYFDMPIQQAAAELRVGVTTLKKVCRVNNIGRWPFRKRSSLNRLIEKTREYFASDPEQCAEALAQLEAQRSVLRAQQGEDIPDTVKRYRQSIFKLDYKVKKIAKERRLHRGPALAAADKAQAARQLGVLGAGTPGTSILGILTHGDSSDSQRCMDDMTD